MSHCVSYPTDVLTSFNQTNLSSIEYCAKPCVNMIFGPLSANGTFTKSCDIYFPTGEDTVKKCVANACTAMTETDIPTLQAAAVAYIRNECPAPAANSSICVQIDTEQIDYPVRYMPPKLPNCENQTYVGFPAFLQQNNTAQVQKDLAALPYCSQRCVQQVWAQDDGHGSSQRNCDRNPGPEIVKQCVTTSCRGDSASVDAAVSAAQTYMNTTCGNPTSTCADNKPVYDGGDSNNNYKDNSGTGKKPVYGGDSKKGDGKNYADNSGAGKVVIGLMSLVATAIFFNTV